MQIIGASIDDVPAICSLVNSAYRGDTSRRGWTTEADLLDGIRIDEEMLREYLGDGNSIILKCANDNQEIIGSVYLKKKQDQLYLGMLTVSPELQAKGIGKLLLKASEEQAKDMGCKSIVMTVITTRTELIAWYKRHGYYETGERQPFPASERFGKPKMHLEFLVMEKSL
ncbi:GNAT family N-acetyltransferase [Segetibacter sp.]|jgi:ribosomal protein S18 acetylase RimI-like enzyme|uniref:GNAT family N-acetyltransferase n=1 Tax=Segetibacter sp. TaxID=2231182 RepID=UPI0026257979|nr:GNAT family N-acetyltransferase [Segetibacter sp.]MCW3081014.1 GCN5-related N-acetyltransferase [Segetibacter sp.]